MARRKLFELWEVSGADSPTGTRAYHIEIQVGAFQHRELGIQSPAAAEEAATYEALEVMRKLLRDFDTGEAGLMHKPPERPTPRRRR